MTLSHLSRRYPYSLSQVLTGPEDLQEPVALHPIFHGSYDWHSCVHGWWQVLRLARRFPAIPEADEIRARAGAMFVAENVAGELARLDRPDGPGFERPYGWAWALALHDELSLHEASHAQIFEPLARRFADQFKPYLAKLTYPVRVGAHGNTAFALALAHDWARSRDAELCAIIAERAEEWFAAESDYRVYEPSGGDFLSPTLTAAMLIRAVRPRADFSRWFADYLPAIAEGAPRHLLTPAFVSDRRDGKIVHLDGLNLSRAWCFRSIANSLEDELAARVLRKAAERHIASSLPHIGDDYMGSHWLATFALLALNVS